MNDGILHRIARVKAEHGHRLLITWSDEEQSSVDFSDTIARGGIWSVLREPSIFGAARVAREGKVVEWPEPAGPDGDPRIDIDADGLHAMALSQRAAPWFGGLLHSLFGKSRAA